MIFVQLVNARYVAPIWHRRVRAPVGGYYTACGKRLAERKVRLAGTRSPDEQDKCRVCERTTEKKGVG